MNCKQYIFKDTILAGFSRHFVFLRIFEIKLSCSFVAISYEVHEVEAKHGLG